MVPEDVERAKRLPAVQGGAQRQMVHTQLVVVVATHVVVPADDSSDASAGLLDVLERLLIVPQKRGAIARTRVQDSVAEDDDALLSRRCLHKLIVKPV